MRTVFKCTLCEFEIKPPQSHSYYKSHYAMRKHFEDQHPKEFEEMRRAEIAIRSQYYALQVPYGLALRPLNMDL